ncbi:hypothetical protein Gohar_007998, partial [Gossypium harknessii]|nr:hypothetical protein [Gossypium harknessii]
SPPSIRRSHNEKVWSIESKNTGFIHVRSITPPSIAVNDEQTTEFL